MHTTYWVTCQICSHRWVITYEILGCVDERSFSYIECPNCKCKSGVVEIK